MDMSKYLNLFLSESQEHLVKMDGLLLQLERDGADRTAIDSLFREAHSLKGMSASMGYEELAAVAHRMEDFLDRFREGQAALDRTAVDLCLEGVDLIRRGIEGLAGGGSGAVKADDYLARVTAHLGGASAVAAGGEVTAPGLDAERLEQARLWAEERGLHLFALEVTIAPDAPLPAARGYITLKRLAEMGEVVHAVPTLEQVQAGEFAGTLSLVLTSTHSPAEVEAAGRRLPDVAQVVSRPLTGPAPRVAPPPPAAPPRPPDPSRPAAVAPPAGGTAVSRTGGMVRVEARLLDDLMDQVGELVTAKGTLVEEGKGIAVRSLREGLARLEQLVQGLQEQALKLRMMPLDFIADRFPRAVRDLAKRRGKEVEFEIRGREIELDRAILEELADPLLHILRNAVDHGIEAPVDRLARGKPAVGRLVLEARKDRERVVIRVTDDGRGMDPGRLRQIATEKGLLRPDQAAALSDEDALRLVTLPGFSTAEEVTEVSGRGVGMDVVRTTLESLRGNLQITSTVGVGTGVTLSLPLTLAIIAVLMVRVGDERYAIPVVQVRRALFIEPNEMQLSQGQPVLARDGMLIPVLRLAGALGCPQGESPGQDPGASAGNGSGILTVLADVRGKVVGVVVDQLLGYRDVVVKPLGKALKGLRGFAGVTILGDGSMVLILDLNTL